VGPLLAEYCVFTRALLALCLRRSKPILPLGSVFWLCIGLPFVWVIGQFVIGLAWLTLIVAISKYLINALISLAVVDLVSVFVPYASRAYQGRPLAKILSYVVSVIIILVVLLTSVILVNDHHARLEYEVNAQLKEKAESISTLIKYFDIATISVNQAKPITNWPITHTKGSHSRKLCSVYS